MKFLRTSEIYSELEKFITKSGESGFFGKTFTNTELFLVTPYLKFPEILYERLCSAGKRGVRIVIVFGKTDLSIIGKQRMGNIFGLELYFYKNLHAKIFLTSFDVIICSMNLHDYSLKHNREAGVLSSEVLIDVRKEVDDIINHSKRVYYEGMKKIDGD